MNQPANPQLTGLHLSPVVKLGAAKAVGLKTESSAFDSDRLTTLFTAADQAPVHIFLCCTDLFNSPKLLDKLVKLLKRCKKKPESITILLSGLDQIKDSKAIKNWCNTIRSVGFNIAIDNFVFNPQTLGHFSRIQPDYLFIASEFTQNIAKNAQLQSYAEYLLRFSLDFNCKLIAENITSTETYECLVELGFSLFSGPLFEDGSSVNRKKLLKAQATPNSTGKTLVSEMIEMALMLPPYISMQDTELELIAKNKTMAVIIDNDIPLGLIYKAMIDRKFSQRLGRELFEKKPVSLFMDTRALTVSENTPIELVAKRLGQFSNTEYLGQHFFITRNGKYQGIGTARNLLERITNLRIEQASHNNPLTGIPGQVPLTELISNYKECLQPFELVYLDLDHFKAFNDLYGYSRGDQAIQLLGHLLTHVHRHPKAQVFHIGGDDFAVVWKGDGAAQWARKIQASLATDVETLYDRKHAKAGFITSVDRKNNLTDFPLMTVSVGIVVNGLSYDNEKALSQAIAKAKKKAKASNEVITYHR